MDVRAFWEYFLGKGVLHGSLCVILSSSLMFRSHLSVVMLGYTENVLEIPTTFKQGIMEIKVGGTVRLAVGFTGGDDKAAPWKYVSFCHRWDEDTNADLKVSIRQ